MSRPLRVVQIAGFPVLPAAAGGKIRIVKMARALCALGAEVTIVAPFHLTQTRALAAQEPFSLREVPYPFLLPFLLTDLPFPYGALVPFHPGYRLMLGLRLEDFDVCQVHHPAFVDVVQDLSPKVPVVYDAQNVEYDYVSLESPPGPVRRISGSLVRRLEARLVERAAHLFACSDQDRRRFAELYGPMNGKATVLPNGIDLAAVDRRRDQLEADGQLVPPRLPRRAIFAGSAVVHNHQAARTLATRVAPALEDQVEFVIVGSCARRLRGSRQPNLTLDPDGDVARWSGPGAVGINPVTQGSGTSLKVLDYLAHGLPVLSTPFGLRGFEDLAPWVRTAEIEDFPAALQGALDAPEGIRDHIAGYEWHRIAKDALDVYESLAARKAS